MSGDLKYKKKKSRFQTLCRVCLVTVAKGHPILQPNKEIVKVDFQVGANTNRMQNKVSGKRKKVTKMSPCFCCCMSSSLSMSFHWIYVCLFVCYPMTFQRE